MKKLKRCTSLPILIAAMALTACGSESLYQTEPPVGDLIDFRTETKDDFATRSAGHTTTGVTAIRSMGIYGAYTTNEWNAVTDRADGFFKDLAVQRASPSASWLYADEKYWPGTGRLSFFAYAPHSDNSAYGNNKPSPSVSAAGIPRIGYTVAATHTDQVDLLVSTPVFNQTKRDYVTIPLRHALTKIAFSARVVNDLPAGTTLQITSIGLKNLWGSGSVEMNGQNREWTLTGTNDQSYTQTTAAGGGLNPLSLTSLYQLLTPADGALFLMPQTLAEGDATTGATVSITYQTQVGSNTPDVKTFDLELAKAITKFDPGMAYNLMIVINNGVTFIVVPTPWDNTEVKVDTKNRILNVSRIEAGVYDGALTRIHFWSNQPKDSVYVFPKGRMDNSRYPTGAEYTVDNIYQSLSNATASNLHYGGFSGTTASGEGYIDICHTPATVADAIRHIWLNASGLVRNIRLDSQFRATPVSLPYIGTFHRWNEQGERIIAWEAASLTDTESWEAEILDPNGSGAEVLIDRFASPFYGDPVTPLYTPLPAPEAGGDPEMALVENPTTRVTSVSGVGKRIYFRVGWKRVAGIDRTAVRYARIAVKRVTGNVVLSTLHLRQGEEPDFVMRPAETGTSMNTRSHAVKFSPYNLTSKGLSNGIQVSQIAADRSNAAFTQYPTQAGAHFQWANAANPRRAHSPVNPLSAPPTWNVDVTSALDYWASIKGTHESCPPGYRRPADGSITSNAASTAAASETRQSLWQSPPSGENSDLANSAWGYYADGYFDRHRITNPVVVETTLNLLTAVSASDIRVAYVGRLFYNANTWASLFFPASGARPNDQGDLQSLGLFGDYLTTANPSGGSSNRRYLLTSSIEAMMFSTKASYAHSIRCVRDLIFTTTLPPYNETGVPTALAFDADARNASPSAVAVDATFIMKWNSTMARDFRLHTESNGAGGEDVRKITAKVTFRGTTGAGLQAIDTDLFASALTRVGSTVAYVFSDAALLWHASGTIFRFKVHEGWIAHRYLGTSTLVDQSMGGVVVGSSVTSETIDLITKGRIVFSRITAPPATP